MGLAWIFIGLQGSVDYLENRFKAGRTFTGQSLIKTVPGKAGIAAILSHPLSPRDPAKLKELMSDETLRTRPGIAEKAA